MVYYPFEDLEDGIHVVGFHLKYRLVESLHEVPQRLIFFHLNVLQGVYILLLACRTQVVAEKCLRNITKLIDRVLREAVKPRQGQTVEASKKDITKQYIIPNFQCHQLLVM